MKRSQLVLAGVAGVTLLGLASPLIAGPITPPPGPVASTHKTLTEIEPRIAINATNTPGDGDSLYKITQPGSYYVTGNITGVAAKHGIEITASGVTLDLNGFQLAGVAGSLDGVSTTASGLSRVVVKNGHIRAWGDKGVDFLTQLTASCHVQDLTLDANGGAGLGLFDSSIAERCISTNNGGIGIDANAACTLTECHASSNGLRGIQAGANAVLRGCAAYSNVGIGIQTIGAGATVSDCTSYNNLGAGFSLGAGTTISNSTATSNSQGGITVGESSTVSHCVSQSNGATGFYIGGGGTIQDCTANANTQAGIQLTFRCIALSNTSVSNNFGSGDSIGILASSSGNRIEGNHCATNTFGILIGGTGNLIVRNTCTANTTNWSIGSNNVFGPILDRRSPGSGSVSGNSASSSLGTTDPNANFTY